MATRIEGRWRVGRTLGRTLYIGDTLVGMLDDSLTALHVANALNYAEANGYCHTTVEETPHVRQGDTERPETE